MDLRCEEILRTALRGEAGAYAGLIERAAERLHDFNELIEAGLICKDGDFFPSVHYPPITMYPPITEEGLFNTYQVPEDGLFDLYVHFPFCINFCFFCHYPNRIGELSEEKDLYLDKLEQEMDIYMNRLGLKRIQARSILIGGGTPTYLAPKQLERFLRFFAKRVDLKSCTQFNYDVDPNTLLGSEGLERLKIMKDFGVTRLTIGIQSFNDDELKDMNRAHDAREAVESVENCRRFGFDTNIEFIYGYPGQTILSWIKTIEKAVTLDVEEIQVYRLKFIPYGDHPGTIFKKYRGKARIDLFYQTVIMKELSFLLFPRYGYSENLRRVFSKDRKHYSHYAHNQCCNLYDQIGFGLTAFSSMRDRFGLNTQNFNEYYSAIDQGRLPLNRGLVRSREDQIRWAIILPLKNRSVRKGYFHRVTGVSFDDIFQRKRSKLKEFDLIHEDERMMGLTERGIFFADEVSHQFHHPGWMPFPEDAYNRGPLYPYDEWELEIPSQGQ